MQRSLSGAEWKIGEPDMQQVHTLTQRHDLPEYIARLLVLRGISEPEVPAFLNPTFQNDLPAPSLFAGMDQCARDVATAIQGKKSFAIFGDFDVDGATSSAVAHRFLKACGVDAPIYIPERLTEGYGPNEQALQSLRDQGVDVLLMLDCGTGAKDTIAAGQDMGLQIVILDHHEAGSDLPPAWHVINPKRKDDSSGLDMLAAVGVTFYFCIAVNAQLKKDTFYNKNNIKQPNLKELLDLVALGTVCDMVPLVHVNRLLVKQGFKQMDSLSNAGVSALASVSGIAPPFAPYHAGYVFGPRVNAGSRVGKSSLGAQLFTLDASHAQEAETIAWTLNDCNAKRKDMQASMEAEALAMVDQKGLADDTVIIVAREGWHSGLTGLVAGRLKEHYGRPACVICLEDGLGKGSGRSIEGIHLGQVFIDAMDKALISKGGGHAMAGGFTLAQDQIDTFSAFVQDHVNAQINSELPTVSHQIEGVVSVRGALNLENAKRLHEDIGPFGMGFEEPLFLLKGVRIVSADIVGAAHVRLLLSDSEGGARIKAMAFRAAGTAMGEAFVKQKHQAFDIIGQLKINSWQGRETVELHVRDARPA